MRNIKIPVAVGLFIGAITAGVVGYVLHDTSARADYLATQLELFNMEQGRGISDGNLSKLYHKGTINAANEYLAGDKK